MALRFGDWTGLGVAERAQFSATAESLARCLEPRFNAFVMFENARVLPGGVLGGTYPDPDFAVDMATQAELDAEADARGAADNLLASGITAANAYAAKPTMTATK